MESTYYQIANENLHNLRLQTSSPSKQLLQYTDQEVSQRRANERAVDSHLGHSRADVVAMLADIFRDPGCEHFL